MRENGWLEEEFRAANKRVREWPEWKKEIEAKSSSLETKEPAPEHVKSMSERAARKKANNALYTLGLRYHDGLPIKEIDTILVWAGFQSMEEAIYCGRDGHVHEQVGPNTWLLMSWHKMDVTGKYEVTAYVS